jgi:hypothetical protein
MLPLVYKTLARLKRCLAWATSKTQITLSQDQAARLELLSNIGTTLLQIQKTEYVIKHLVQRFLRANNMTWKQLLSYDEGEQRKTMGYFLSELRKHIPIRPDFDKTLSNFLAARNVFAHDLTSIPNFSLNNEAGIESGLHFVRNLNEQAVSIRGVLTGLMRIMMNEDSLKGDIGPDVTDNQIDELMALGAFLQNDYWEDEDKDPYPHPP